MKDLSLDRSLLPETRQFALNILDYYKIPSHHYLDECRAIAQFVQKHVIYRRDPLHSELLQDPIMMMKRIDRDGKCEGDCDDMSLLIACLILSVGGEPFFRAVRYGKQSGHYNHIYVVCYDRNGKNQLMRIALDAIIKDKPIGYEVPHTSGDEFSVMK